MATFIFNLLPMNNSSFSRVALLAFTIFSLALASCSSSKAINTNSNTYQVRLGVSKQNTIDIETPRIFTRFGYQILRNEANVGEIFYETRWKKRAATEDERKLGIKQANTRLTLRAKPRVTAGIYSVILIAENQYQDTETGEWRPSPLTDMAKDKIKEISDVFKTEFQVKGLN